MPAKPEKRNPQKGRNHLPADTLIVDPTEAKAPIERPEPLRN